MGNSANVCNGILSTVAPDIVLRSIVSRHSLEKNEYNRNRVSTLAELGRMNATLRPKQPLNPRGIIAYRFKVASYVKTMSPGEGITRLVHRSKSASAMRRGSLKSR